MDIKDLRAHPRLDQYLKLAEDLASAFNSGDAHALQRIREYFGFGSAMTLEVLRHNASQQLGRLREEPKLEGPEAILSLSDAQHLISNAHGFESWQSLAQFVVAINNPDSEESQFESAVDMVVTGNAAALESALQKNPNLIRARSSRLHGATLLHYVSANGVEDFRHKTAKNAVDIARILLKAGAEVDADLAYGASSKGSRAGSTTLGLVATSIHPAHAGVQTGIMELLLEAGASVDGLPGGWSLVNASLANGRPEAAQFLASRGARLDLEGAAGVGRLDLVEKFFNKDGSLNSGATRAQMDSGFMWACEFGHTGVVEFLLNKGFDIATDTGGMTGLHWAMVGGHADTIKFLLDRKAPLEIPNAYGGTALGCAIWAVANSDPVYQWPDTHTDWLEIVGMLIDAGARVYEYDDDFPTGNAQVDELLRLHGMKPPSN